MPKVRPGELEAALERERLRREQLFERAPVAQLLTDTSGHILDANSDAVALLGVQREALAGEPLTAFVTDGERARLRQLLDRLAAEGAGEIGPLQLRRPGGGGATVTAVVVSAGGAEGTELHWLLQDVAAQKRRERAEREFVENAAHQLRTPLTAITSAIQVLQSGAKEDPETRDRFLEHIERESGRLTRLARALLVLARAQTAQQQPSLQIVELEPLLRQLAQATEVAEGIELVVEPTPDAAALANAELLEEALASLLANAVRYTERGRIVLTTSRREDRTLIEVSDTGPGIDPELQERMFERFARGDGRDGFGLGLAIARQAVAAMDGTLEIVSEPGRGTVARITLLGAKLVRP